MGRPIPARLAPMPQDEARALFDLPEEGRVLGVFGALAGARSLNEFVVETWAADGPPILHLTGRRDFDLVRRRVQREDYRVMPRPTGSARRCRQSTSCSHAPRLGLGGRRRRQARRLRAVSVRDRRPSGGERAAFRAHRRRRAGARARPRRRPRTRRARCSTTRRGSSGWARRCSPRRGRMRPRRSRTSSSRCGAVKGRRLWFVGIGGAGLSAYAQVAARPRAEVGGWDRCARRTSTRSAVRPSRSRAEPVVAGRLGGRGLVARTAVPGLRRASSCVSSSRGRDDDRRRRHARQGDDRGADRLRPARDRARPGVADRCARAPARLERRLRRGLLVVEGDESDRTVFSFRA